MTALSYQATVAPSLNASGVKDIIDIGRDYSKTPGGRYIRHGPYSGEDFRRRVLLPRFQSALEKSDKLHVRIDTVLRSYQSSFLDEAFAGLIRDEGFSARDVHDHLVIVSDIPRFEKYKALAEKYVNDVS